jgi:membrane protease YdiL (CAAX protease family)
MRRRERREPKRVLSHDGAAGPGGRGTDLASDAALAAGLAVAGPAFTAVFRGPRERFWSRMTLTGLLLGGLALLAVPSLRRTRIGPREAALGLVSAAALYGTFEVGDRFARRFVPGGARQIGEIYALRELAPRGQTALRLAAVVAPAEELFWRGLVQGSLMRRYGRWRGAALATMAYSAVHVTSGNFTLVGAAGVAGAHWSALYAAGLPMGALVVSHSAWDIWIFLIQPTGEIAAVRTPETGQAAGPATRPDAGGQPLGTRSASRPPPAPGPGPTSRPSWPGGGAGGGHDGARGCRAPAGAWSASRPSARGSAPGRRPPRPRRRY